MVSETIAAVPESARRPTNARKAVALHLSVLGLLFALQFVLSDYDKLTVTRVMVLAIYASGYNVLYGYVGLLSLGHALFFSIGLYTAGLSIQYLHFSAPLGFVSGFALTTALSFPIGFVMLRTRGVSFMIVTMMFAQAGYLLIMYYTEYTQGDAGLALRAESRRFDFIGRSVDLSNADVRYNIAFGLLVAVMASIYVIIRRPSGRALIAIRENEERTRMLGYDNARNRLNAFVISGGISGLAGAAFATLFAYAGATSASIQNSIDVLLYTLLGGAGTVLGPLVGTGLMVFLIDKTSEFTRGYLLVVGVTLIILIMWFPKGILGTIRERWLPWIP